MAITSFRSRTSKSAIRYYTSKPWYACLSTLDNITANTSLIDLIVSELPPVSGYTRIPINFNGEGQYNIQNSRHEFIGTAEFRCNPLGNAWQFHSGFILEDSGASSAIVISSNNINVQNDRIELPNHGKADGDCLIFTPDPLGSLFSIANQQITSQVIYKVINSNSDNFQIAALDSNSPLDITNAGGGNIFAKNANGEEVFFFNEPEEINLLPGQPYTLTLPFYYF